MLKCGFHLFFYACLRLQYAILLNFGFVIIQEAKAARLDSLKFLVFANVAVIGLAMIMGIRRHFSEFVWQLTSLYGGTEIKMAFGNFGRKKFDSILDSLATKIPPNNCLVYIYSSVTVAQKALEEGITALEESVIFTMHRPYEIGDEDVAAFPVREAVLVVSLPSRLLVGTYPHSRLRVLSSRAVTAMQVSATESIISKHCVIGAFQLTKEDLSNYNVKEEMEDNENPVESATSTPIRLPTIKTSSTCEELANDLDQLRRTCTESGYFMLYHYADSRFIAPIRDDGIRLSDNLIKDQDGIAFTWKGPASLGIGSHEYGPALRLSCFCGSSVPKEFEHLNACVVYGVEPCIVSPAGKNYCVVSGDMFKAFSAPQQMNYFLRSDRILGIFILDTLHPLIGRGDSILSLAAAAASDYATFQAMTENWKLMDEVENDIMVLSIPRDDGELGDLKVKESPMACMDPTSTFEFDTTVRIE